MTTIKTKIKENYILFENEGIHVGCGFLIIISEKLYCVTAGHVVFSKNFDKERSLKIKNFKNIEFNNFKLLTNAIFAKTFDLAIFQFFEDANEYNYVQLYKNLVNPKLTSLSFIKATQLNESYFLEPITYSDSRHENELIYKAPCNSFNNFAEDEHGAQAME